MDTNRSGSPREIVLIAAMASNRVIGQGERIPWHVPGEQKRFRDITMGYPLIMGRKTWQSIGRPLPGRRNIILTRDPSFQASGAEIAHSFTDALRLAADATRVFVIGGEQIYRLALPHADTLILTLLPFDAPGDAFFPDVSPDLFSLLKEERVSGDPPYVVQTYGRRGSPSR